MTPEATDTADPYLAAGDAVEPIEDVDEPEPPTEPDDLEPSDHVGAVALVATLRWVEELALALTIGLVARYWLISSRQPSWWQDSDDYFDTSREGLGSLALWAGERPVAVPLLLKLVDGDGMGFMEAQVGLAALCWAVLAKQVMNLMPESWVRWFAGIVVVAFSLAEPLTMWDRSVLSESLASSALALLAAALLRLVRRPTWVSAGLLVAATAVWMATRDTHAWLVMIVVGAAFGALIAVYVARRMPPPSPVAVCLAALSLVAVLAIVAADHGGRSDFPMRNVYQARILPYPDRVAWFADHGMPQADEFLGPDRRPPYLEPGMAPMMFVPEDDRLLEEWNDWVATDGAAAFRLWVLTHPSFLWSEPGESPERVFNNAEGNRSFYAAADRRTVPFVTEIFFPSRPLAIVVAAGLVTWSLLGRRRRSPAFYVGAAAVVAALPHAALSWHADAMETARHLVIPVLQLHLGVLLLLLDVVVVQVGKDTADQPIPENVTPPS